MRLAANLSTQFHDGPWKQRAANAAACGFKVVEMQWPYADIAGSDLRRALDDGGMTAVLINAPVGTSEATRFGFASRRDQDKPFQAAMEQAIDYAGTLGASLIHVLVGVGGEREVLIDRLRATLDILPDGLSLVLEAINRTDVPGYHLASIADAVSVVEAVGDHRLGVMVDLYHADRNGEDVAAEIQDHASIIKHVQLSDHPGRGEPGSGQIDFGPALEALRDIGYEGAIGCEFRPSGAATDCMGWREALGLSF